MCAVMFRFCSFKCVLFVNKGQDLHQSKQTYGEHVDKLNHVEMKHVSELATIGLLLKPLKT